VVIGFPRDVASGAVLLVCAALAKGCGLPVLGQNHLGFGGWREVMKLKAMRN